MVKGGGLTKGRLASSALQTPRFQKTFISSSSVSPNPTLQSPSSPNPKILHPNPNIQYQAHLHTLSLDLKMFRVPNFSHQGSWFWVLAWDWEGEKRRWAVGSGRREKGEEWVEGIEEKTKKQIKKHPKTPTPNPQNHETRPKKEKKPPSKIQTMPKNPQTTNSISPHPSQKQPHRSNTFPGPHSPDSPSRRARTHERMGFMNRENSSSMYPAGCSRKFFTE